MRDHVYSLHALLLLRCLCHLLYLYFNRCFNIWKLVLAAWILLNFFETLSKQFLGMFGSCFCVVATSFVFIPDVENSAKENSEVLGLWAYLSCSLNYFLSCGWDDCVFICVVACWLCLPVLIFYFGFVFFWAIWVVVWELSKFRCVAACWLLFDGYCCWLLFWDIFTDVGPVCD